MFHPLVSSGRDHVTPITLPALFDQACKQVPQTLGQSNAGLYKDSMNKTSPSLMDPPNSPLKNLLVLRL